MEQPSSPTSLPALAFWFVFVAATFGTILASYLGVTDYLGERVAGCGDEVGCGALQRSTWSRWLGVPVGIVAAAAYLVAAVLLFVLFRGPATWRVGWHLLRAGAATMLGAACWFVGLQLWLQQSCFLCNSVHFCGVAIGIFAFSQGPPGRTIGAVAGLAAVFVLIAGQMLPTAESSQRVKQIASFGLGVGVLTSDDYPRLGPASADRTILELFDYTCPHCRTMHERIEQARRQDPFRIAVLTLVVPLHPDCNSYMRSIPPGNEDACILARLSLAIWLLAPERYEDYHRWLSEAARSPRQARERALEFIDAQKLIRALNDPAIDRQLKSHLRIYAQLGGGVLPKLIVGQHLLEGEPNNSHQLLELLSDN